MDSERWSRVQDLLARALELPAERRPAFLDGECPDTELRAEVESLVAASDQAHGFFEDLAGRAGLSPTTGSPGGDEDSTTDLTGRRVGAYRLQRFLGRGGMGTVYEAERVDGQFRQHVAIKLLSLHATHGDTHRRFLAEREILARLEHPNIARLFDGGVTEDGTPYFIMELVDGTPIHEHCDRLRLGVDERLRAFLAVCDAVSHAHQNRVVHRDLKPHNILVSEHGVKLLDFGIAKLLEGEAGGTITATGSSPMTPAYAAPEQLKGGPVTTATDVYSLGVVLHELLTGLSPYEMSESSSLAMARAICDQPVTSPSTRLRRLRAGTGGDPEDATTRGQAIDLEAISQARGTSLASLGKRLSGDLDTILLKALQKEPARRYASVADLADDLRRHLDGLPVRARRDSVGYRFTRFVVRHRVVVFAACLTVLLASALAIQSLWFADRSSSQEDLLASEQNRAEALLGQLTELYESADPAASPGDVQASRRLLDLAVGKLEGSAGEDPATRATLLFAAGRVYRRLGAADAARPILREALELRRALHEAPHEGINEVLYELGACLARSGDTAAGVALLQEALGASRTLLGDDHLHVAQLRYELGTAFHEAGGDSEAEFREAVRIFRAHPAAPTDEYAAALTSLGDIEAVRQKLEPALALYEEALDIYTTLHGDTHPMVAHALNGIGMLRYSLGDEEEAIELLEEAVAIDRDVYGEEGHLGLAAILQNLGNVLVFEGDEAGVVALEEAVAIHRRWPARASDFGFCATSLGKARQQFGDRDGAVEAFEEALAVYASQDVQPMFQTEARQSLARLLLEDGPSERAVELLGAVAEGYETFLPADHARVIEARRELEAARQR